MNKDLKGKIIQKILEGGIVVYPTDTLYGMLVRAEDAHAVENLYHMRERDPKKPFILLVSSVADVEKWCPVSAWQKSVLKKLWPGKISVVLPCKKKTMQFLHRGTESLAFRMPDVPELRDIIKKTGPLAAPTANLQGEKPAETVSEARRVFGGAVSLYVAGGVRKSEPSTLISLDRKKISVLRKGADFEKVRNLIGIASG